MSGCGTIHPERTVSKSYPAAICQYGAKSHRQFRELPSAICQLKCKVKSDAPTSRELHFFKPVPRGQGPLPFADLRFCCRMMAPAALILLAQNAVALVAEPSPLIRKVTEWLQTVSPLARSYILLNTPNDGPARRRGTRDPTGSQGV